MTLTSHLWYSKKGTIACAYFTDVVFLEVYGLRRESELQKVRGTNSRRTTCLMRSGLQGISAV